MTPLHAQTVYHSHSHVTARWGEGYGLRVCMLVFYSGTVRDPDAMLLSVTVCCNLSFDGGLGELPGLAAANPQ